MGNFNLELYQYTGDVNPIHGCMFYTTIPFELVTYLQITPFDETKYQIIYGSVDNEDIETALGDAAFVSYADVNTDTPVEQIVYSMQSYADYGDKDHYIIEHPLGHHCTTNQLLTMVNNIESLYQFKFTS